MSDQRVRDAIVSWFDRFAEQGIFTTDEQLRITTWNAWLERHMGRAASDTVGRHLFELYPDLKERGFDEQYENALTGGAYLAAQLLHRYLLPIPARVGDDAVSFMRQRARIAPLLVDGRVAGTITVIDDVSERVASEQELRRQIEAQEIARGAAEKALRVKDEFLATLSHEIRTPLNAVLGWARILSERELEPGLRTRALDSIYRNATVQARMIDDLLDTARMMSGKLRLNMQTVDLVPVTIAALDALSPIIETKHIELKQRLDHTVERVIGDPDRLQQIVWNLLSNAAKFTEPGGTIEIRLNQSGTNAVMTVSDDGKGIEPEFLPFLFERFRQADTSSSRREGGLGLGLALVRELVELHGGTVRASSPGRGQGSMFVVEFPTVSSPEVGRLSDRDALASALPLAGQRVLVVEDEEDARELLSAILSSRGAQVTVVGSSEAALRFMRAAGPDLRPHVIVSDIGMADQDGYDLIRGLRELPPEDGGALPAVAVTAYSSAADRGRALAAGYQMHVSKPVDPAALVAAITAATMTSSE